MASSSSPRSEAEAPDAVWAVEVLPGQGSHDALSLAISDAKKLKERHVSIKLVHVTCAVSCGLGGELPVSRVDKRVVRAHEVSVFQTLVHPLVKLAERRQVAVKYVPVCNDIRETGLVQAVERIGARRVYLPVQKSAMRKFEALCLVMPGGCCLVAVQDGKRILEHDVAVVSLVESLDGTDTVSTGLERQPSLRSTTEESYMLPPSPIQHSSPTSVCLSPLSEHYQAKSSSVGGAGQPPHSPKSLMGSKQRSKSLKGEQMSPTPSSSAIGLARMSPQLPLRRTQTTKYLTSPSSSFQERKSGPLRRVLGDLGEPCGMLGGRVQSQPHLSSGENLMLDDCAGSPGGGEGKLVRDDDVRGGSFAAFPPASTRAVGGPQLPRTSPKSFSSESLPLSRAWGDDVSSEAGQQEDVAGDVEQQVQLQQQMLMQQQMMLMQQQMQQQQYQQRQHLMFAKLQHQQQQMREPVEVTELGEIQEGLEVDVLPQDSFQREMVQLQQHWQEYSEEQSALQAQLLQHLAQQKLEEQQRLHMSILEQELQLLGLEHLKHHQHHSVPPSHSTREHGIRLGSGVWEGMDKNTVAAQLVQIPQDAEGGAGEDKSCAPEASGRKYRSRNLACAQEGIRSRSGSQATRPTPMTPEVVRRSESDTSSRRHGRSPSWGIPELVERVPGVPALPGAFKAPDAVTPLPARGRAVHKRVQGSPRHQQGGSVQDDVDMGERHCSQEAVALTSTEKKVFQRWFSLGTVRGKAT